MKAYTLMKGITGKQGTSDAAWEAYRQFAQEAKNGLPASGRNMLKLPRGDKDGDKARDRFHHLLLDSLKKDRQTETKSGLSAAARKRKSTADDSGEDEASMMRPITAPIETIRVVVISRSLAEDLTPATGQFKWATARVKQLVALRDITVAELIKGIRPRIRDGQFVRAIYGAITKPPVDGTGPEDVERITSDTDLANFVAVTSGAYKPIMVQVQTAAIADEANQTPPPDDRPYFTKNQFNTEAGDNYDPAVSDSENELYLIKFGKRKAKAWPRSDHGFEHQKAKCRMRLTRMRKHLEELKRRHRKFMGPKKAEIIDSDDEGGFSWLKWLNPQDGKSYVRARAAANAAAIDLGINLDQKASEKIALAAFGKRGKGDFNLWSDNEQASDSSSDESVASSDSDSDGVL